MPRAYNPDTTRLGLPYMPTLDPPGTTPFSAVLKAVRPGSPRQVVSGYGALINLPAYIWSPCDYVPAYIYIYSVFDLDRCHASPHNCRISFRQATFLPPVLVRPRVLFLALSDSYMTSGLTPDGFLCIYIYCLPLCIYACSGHFVKKRTVSSNHCRKKERSHVISNNDWT